MGEGWISGGYMVCEPELLDHIPDIKSGLEGDVLEKLSSKGELMAYRHHGFWQCMDTVRDMNYLENLWTSGQAPWKLWDKTITHQKMPHFLESNISYQQSLN